MKVRRIKPNNNFYAVKKRRQARTTMFGRKDKNTKKGKR